MADDSTKFKLKSKYFNYHATDREQKLVNSLIKEAIHINGLNMLFIPRQYVNLDRIYGEDVLSSFNKTYEMVFYVESSEAYEGNNSFFGNMGYDIQDRSTLILSRDVFKQVVIDSPDNVDGHINESGPRNGDLIYWPTTGRIFEVVDCQMYKMFYQLGKLYTYKITIEFWDYSNEKLDTKLPEIDKKFDNDIVKKYEISLASAPNNAYIVGEQVYTGNMLVSSDFVGEVEHYNPATRKLIVASAYGLPVNGQTLTGDDSGAAVTISSFTTLNIANPQRDNEQLKIEAAEIIKKDPEDDKNPGGGYGYGY